VNRADPTFVLALVHRDPLKRVKELVKLECFSGSRFNRLKELISQVVPSVRRGKRGSTQGRIRQEQAIRYQIEDVDDGCDFSQMDMRGKRLWWKRMRWDSVVEPDNPWGGLSYEAEAALKALLKG
jgi:hypothetical protein